MKPTKLIIENIGMIAGKTIIEINKPLILFYGEIKQGKTTILNCVRWVCGGEFPGDIISHGAQEGSIELHFDGGMIARSFYRAKKGADEGETKARPVVFVKGGKPVPSPVSEIKRLLNPFLLDQDFLRNKSELERKQYFADLFAVDTTVLDTELFNNQRDATSLRAKIGGYGEIDLVKVEAVNVAASQSRLSTINAQHDLACAAIEQENDAIRTHNACVERAEATKGDIQKAIEAHEKKLLDLRAQLAAINPGEKKTLKVKPVKTDTAALETEIREAGATNVRAEQYAANLKRAEAKKVDGAALAALEKRGREIKSEKQAKLKSIGETCGIAGLEFDESGNFIYDGATAGMISDSQIMRLSSELSGLYPDGFGLDLLDRAESLGKSIFEFVDKAKAENKSILATIVGERPATVPQDVGVFVVENGKLSTGELL